MMENPEQIEQLAEGQKEPSFQRSNSKRATVLVTCLLILVIIFCLWVVSQVLSRGYVSVGGYSMFRVVTGSMEPEIPVGALLISKQTDIDEVQINDIVVFRSKSIGMSEVTITHRVVGIHEKEDGTRYLETKGDANQYTDGSLVDAGYLIGRVVFYTGKGNVVTGLLSILTSKIGFLACIVLPCILIGLFTMRDCIKNLRSEMRNIRKELDEAEKNRTEEPDTVPPAEEKEESYEELCERLRGELLEELKQSAEQAKTKQKPGAKQQ